MTYCIGFQNTCGQNYRYHGMICSVMIRRKPTIYRAHASQFGDVGRSLHSCLANMKKKAITEAFKSMSIDHLNPERIHTKSVNK